MDITDAFQASQIARMQTDLTASEESEISEFLNEIWEGEMDESVRNLALLTFVAGRTYQAAHHVINVPMSPELVAKFMEYLGRQDV